MISSPKASGRPTLFKPKRCSRLGCLAIVATSACDAVDGSSTGMRVPWKWVLLIPPRFGGANMQAVRAIGLDIAKSVFQVHESLPSSHHWSRELQALGHTVRLMPPAYVKPYVKRGYLRGGRQG